MIQLIGTPAIQKAAPKATVISTVWPMSGSMQQEHDRNGVEAEGDGDARHALALLALGEHPGDQHDQGRLHEFGRLQGEAAELHPAGGALGVRARASGRANMAAMATR